MQKYAAPWIIEAELRSTKGEHAAEIAVYLASEVDARIAELEKARRDVKRFLEDPRWGTVNYMEGTDVYEDKDEALETINSVLMET